MKCNIFHYYHNICCLSYVMNLSLTFIGVPTCDFFSIIESLFMGPFAQYSEHCCSQIRLYECSDLVLQNLCISECYFFAKMHDNKILLNYNLIKNCKTLIILTSKLTTNHFLPSPEIQVRIVSRYALDMVKGLFPRTMSRILFTDVFYHPMQHYLIGTNLLLL